MFNRLKGFNLDSFLDSKIAEEQAKQAKTSQSPKRSGSNAGPRRAGGRTESPAQRGGSRLRAPEGDAAGVIGKSPDPEDFVIGDDASDISRVATPKPVKETAEGPLAEEGKQEATENAASPNTKGKEKAEDDELPEDVRKKLAKLETLTARYQDLLRNYRTAHARVTAIEPFEATLREHTPLTSITEPSALVEFLNQRALQSQMVLEELKSVTGERDELKTKLQEAERKTKEAFDEAAGLREQRSSNTTTSETSSTDPLGVSKVNEPVKQDKKPAGGEADEFFSYEAEQQKSLEDEVKGYKTEIQEHKDYINELSTENASLRKDLDMCQLNLSAMENKVGIKDRDIEGIKEELAKAHEEIDAATKASVEAQDQEQEAAALLAQTEGQVVHLQERLKDYQKSLQEREEELREKAALAEENLKKYQDEHAENLKKGTYSQRDEKGMESLRGLVLTLREQAKKAEEGQREAEGQANDIRLELNRLESEASARGNIVANLREQEAAAISYKRKLEEAEHDRDEAKRLADSKKGHEASVASLRSQLKNAFKERDDAYQMIIDCGKCKTVEAGDEKVPATPTQADTPEPRSRLGSESTEVHVSMTEPATPSATGELEPGDAKKKNKKKKSKTKKKTGPDPTGEAAPAQSSEAAPAKSEMSIDELMANPQMAREVLNKEGACHNLVTQFIERNIEKLKLDRPDDYDGREEVIPHLERTIEERDQMIKDHFRMIQEKDREIEGLRVEISKKEEAIDRLDKKLKGEEDLREEIEQLKDEVLELGSQATDAKHELQKVKAENNGLRDGEAGLEMRVRLAEGELKKAETERDQLTKRCRTVEGVLEQVRGQQKDVSSEELEVVQAQVSSLEKEKEALQLAKDAAEKQVENLKAEHGSSVAEREAKHKTLSDEFEQLSTKAAGLEKDLAAANDLAQTRFKDLTDLRDHSNKLQPELKRLREESDELKTLKADLDKSTAAVKRLEAKENDLRSEIAEYKTQGANKDTEITKLKEDVKQNEERSKALEESYEGARKDLETSQSKRDESSEARDKLQADLKKTEAELQRAKTSLKELEEQIRKARDETNGLREELQNKTAQHTSAQSQMNSQQEQSRELAVQMREIQARNESLEEELSDAQRLLQERSREGETMRRMLSEVETQADVRVKEMRECMDLAVEERDRAEDEASTVGRRKAREIEDLRTKLKDAEQEAKKASEAKEDVERRESGFRDRQAELEKRVAQAQEELNEVKSAMSSLRSSLDESERQTTTLERQKAELKRELDESQHRLEKLQKSSKAMNEELRGLQNANKLRQGSIQSSRSSVDSGRVGSPRITSPAPNRSNGAPVATTGGPNAKESVDYVYLKNVLFQFLEQKEKKHQMQLVPVLGMLLHFDKQDQQKWEAAIAAR